MQRGITLPNAGAEGWVCGPDLIRAINTNAPHNDRRRKLRIPLNWTVRLTRPGESHNICASTKNISSEGMYCNIDGPFAVGEQVECVVFIPAFDPEDPNRVMSMNCLTRVVRVELCDTSSYGMALRIENYTFGV